MKNILLVSDPVPDTYNPYSFLSGRSNRSTLCFNIWSLTLVPDTGHLNSLEFPEWYAWYEHLCSNEATLGELLGSLRMGAGNQKTQPCLEAWNFQSHLQGKERGLETELTTNHEYIIKPPYKVLNDRVWRASRLVSTLRCWEGGAPGEGWKVHTTFPLALCVYHLSLCEIITYNKLIIESRVFSWVLWHIPVNYWL